MSASLCFHRRGLWRWRRVILPGMVSALATGRKSLCVAAQHPLS
ncbi:MAG: hypothetical protein P8080_01460 [Gammaproteobacteria bacterium]